MLSSSYGIVIYEPSGKVHFNPNVSIEAGFMLALDRPVLFLANEKLRGLPVDFAGHIFKTYKSNPDKVGGSARDAVRDWIEHDLSYYDYGKKKLVLFVSLGGTCRCVMGKAILADLADKKKISGLAVEAAAVADPTMRRSVHRLSGQFRKREESAGSRSIGLASYAPISKIEQT
jgi:hypothetical protein